MKFTIHVLFLVLALFCFIMAAAGFHDRFSSLGLAFLTLSFFTAASL